ncbi:unnamed protein product [Mesocestoides corti]|uniref:SEC7 domain-containing protein n=1 Tax=Mesocestoides corti TaxID=53468 RepID=A0A0R3UND2_MESCO|nr:unnamed protein product [Mesocestoides corti]
MGCLVGHLDPRWAGTCSADVVPILPTPLRELHSQLLLLHKLHLRRGTGALTRNDFSQLVGEEFASFFDFTEQSLDTALRYFMTKLSLTGETQERERIFFHFSRRYVACNPGAFVSDAYYVATCSNRQALHFHTIDFFSSASLVAMSLSLDRRLVWWLHNAFRYNHGPRKCGAFIVYPRVHKALETQVRVVNFSCPTWFGQAFRQADGLSSLSCSHDLVDGPVDPGGKVRCPSRVEWKHLRLFPLQRKLPPAFWLCQAFRVGKVRRPERPQQLRRRNRPLSKSRGCLPGDRLFFQAVMYKPEIGRIFVPLPPGPFETVSSSPLLLLLLLILLHNFTIT